MEGTSKILPAMINGILVGFTIGVGFILAKKLLDRPKKVEVVPTPTTVETKSAADGGQNFATMSSDFMFNDSLANDFFQARQNPPQRQAPQSLKRFDFTTGTNW